MHNHRKDRNNSRSSFASRELLERGSQPNHLEAQRLPNLGLVLADTLGICQLHCEGDVEINNVKLPPEAA